MGLRERLAERNRERWGIAPEPSPIVPEPAPTPKRRGPRPLITGPTDTADVATRRCIDCGAVVWPRKHYCAACRRARDRARQKRVDDQRKAERAMRPRVNISASCAVCGDTYLRTRPNHRYCSAACREAGKRASRQASGKRQDAQRAMGYRCTCGGRMAIKNSRSHGTGVRRRRECVDCGRRVSTIETEAP